MNHYIVDGDAGMERISVVVEEGRNGAVIAYEGVDALVQRKRGDSRTKINSDHGERIAYQERAFAHAIDLLFGLTVHHGSNIQKETRPKPGLKNIVVELHLYGRSGLTSLNPSAFHQAVVLTHQQLGLDLLQGIQDDTHHDQQ